MRVMELLPHRYPFLMIDKIIEMDGDDSCIGVKNVTINEPHFQGTLSCPAGDARSVDHRSDGPDSRCALRQ